MTTAISTNAQTGQVLYMSAGTNAVLAAEAKLVTQADAVVTVTDEIKVTSSIDRMNHTIQLGGYKSYSDMVLTATFEAESFEEAKAIACGDQYGNSGIKLAAADDGSEYELKWVDNSVDADKQPDTNALLSYNAETKQAHATISFTDAASYDHNWVLAMNTPADLTLYEMEHMAGLDSADYTYESGTMSVSWQGSLLEDCLLYTSPSPRD